MPEYQQLVSYLETLDQNACRGAIIFAKGNIRAEKGEDLLEIDWDQLMTDLLHKFWKKELVPTP